MIKVLKGEVSGKEFKEFERWLKSSARNQREFNEVKKLWLKFGEIREPAVNLEKEWEIVKSRIGFVRYPNRIIKFVKVTLFAVIILVGLYIGLNYMLKDGDVKVNVVETKRGEMKNLILPDSSLVILNSCSKIVYPEKFGFGIRVVQFEGEGYFICSSEKGSPFYIRTGEIMTIVTGTRFNIRYRDNRYVLFVDTGLVTFIEGGQMFTVKSGEIAFDNEDGVKEVSRGDKNYHLAWINGKIAFKGTPLVEVFKELQNYYDFDFLFVQPDLASKRISGEFNRRFSLEKILEIISFSTGVKIEAVEGEEKVLVKIK